MNRPMYRERVIYAGNTIEIIDTYPTQFGDKVRRENRKSGKGTPEAVKQYNRELAKRKLTRLINNNFVPDDLWITLTYERDNRPQSEEAAKALFRKFIRKLKGIYARHGLELKAIKRTAYGERGAVHHHLIVPQGVSSKEITKLWREVSGASDKARAPHYVPLYPEGEYSCLASYLVEQLSAEEGELHVRKWTCTRNIRKPIEKAPRDVYKIKWNEPIKPRKGYYVDTDSIRAGTNEVTGRPYLFYRMAKIKEGYTCRDDTGKLLRGAEAAEYISRKNKQWIRDNWAEICTEGEVIFNDDG